MRISDQIINPGILCAIAGAGHGDALVVADAGLPIPSGVQCIDLSYAGGRPPFLEVLDTLLSDLIVERAVVAEEMTRKSEAMFTKVRDRMSDRNVLVDTLPHVTVKELTRNAKAIVRTGEFTPYSNIILYSGVPF